MDYRTLITIEPGKRGGKPCIRGLRITVYDVLEYLASGMSADEILSDFPDPQEDPRPATHRALRGNVSHDGGVAVTVRDHGAGVPARHVGRIFEPFYRGENELTRRSKGTGIGLALVRGLAERMGARVTGRNAAGGGFEVEIAFRAAAA